MTTIQYQQLCKVGRILSTAGLNVFMQHITNCKQCKKRLKKWHKTPS